MGRYENMSKSDWRIKYAAELAYAAESTVIPPKANSNSNSKQKMKRVLAEETTTTDKKLKVTTTTSRQKKPNEGKVARKVDRTTRKAKSKKSTAPPLARRTQPQSKQTKTSANVKMAKTSEVKNRPSTEKTRSKLVAKVTSVKGKLKSSGAKYVRKIAKSLQVGEPKSKSVEKVATVEGKAKKKQPKKSVAKRNANSADRTPLKTPALSKSFTKEQQSTAASGAATRGTDRPKRKTAAVGKKRANSDLKLHQLQVSLICDL